MAIAKTRVESLPPWAQSTGRDINMMGLEFLFFENYHLADMAKHIQIRDDTDLAPRGKVIEYAERMRAGDQFPPSIFTSDDWLISGATRELAAMAAKKKSFPAFVLKDAYYQDAPDNLLEKLVTLGGMQNLTHGTDLSATNKARVIEWVARTKGEDAIEDISKQLHVKKQLVREVLAVRDARVRMERLGLDPAKRRLSWTHMLRLGTVSRILNDDPFKAFAELTLDTTLSTTEQQNIMNRMSRCTNDAERLEIIAGEKSSRALTSSGLNRRPPLSAQLRQHLGFINRQGLMGENPPSLLVETSSLKAAEDHYTQLGAAIEILLKARGLQYGFIEKLLAAEGNAQVTEPAGS